jgi:hypothetical protein
MAYKWQGKNNKLYGLESQNYPLKEVTNLTHPLQTNKPPKYKKLNPESK